MKRQNKKRGFTIIELVIVIAVIAILSAVLIPTFSSVIKKSRQSADESAVRNMNTILAAEGVDKAVTITELYEVLDENGISAENYKPLYKDRFFFWDKEENVIIYTNDEYQVLYPANQKDNTNRENWITLSGEIKEASFNEVKIENNNTAKVDSPSELIALANAWNDTSSKNHKEAIGVTNIVLPAGKFNLMGAELGFNGTFKGTFGAEAGQTTTIQGLVDYEAVTEHRTSSKSGTVRNYSAGIFDKLGANAKVQNIVIDNAIVGDPSISIVGVIAGYATGANITIDNVQVKNTTVYGMQKVGGLIGYVTRSSKTAPEPTISITNTTMENVTVKTTAGMAGGIFGYLQYGTVTVGNAEALVAGVKVELNKVSTGNYINYERPETEKDLLDTTLAIDLNDDFTIAEKLYENNTCYRYFATCAKYGFVKSANTGAISGLTGYQGKGVVIAYGMKAAMPVNNVFTAA